MDKELKRAARSAALSTNTNPRVADAIVSSLFKQLRETAEDMDINDPSTIRNFRIINFGVFFSSEEKIKSKQYAIRNYKGSRI